MSKPRLHNHSCQRCKTMLTDISGYKPTFSWPFQSLLRRICVTVAWCKVSHVAHQAGAYPGFSSMKRFGVFLLPLDGMLVHRRVTPSTKFAGTHLYTWVERGIVRVKCRAQEHNTRMSPARAWTRTARSGVKRTNHEATAPLLLHSSTPPRDVRLNNSVLSIAKIDYITRDSSPLDCSHPLYLRTRRKKRAKRARSYPVKSSVLRWRSVLSRFYPRVRSNKNTRK